MKINGKHYTAIWEEAGRIFIIDQRSLPFEVVIEELADTRAVFNAIREMHVRGAPLIGATAAFGMYLAVCESEDADELRQKADFLLSARPTAVDLAYSVRWFLERLLPQGLDEKAALHLAQRYHLDNIERCRQIGVHGAKLIEALAQKKGATVNILTHCNAGWLATGDYGTALAPVYVAHDKGIPVHVWVDETRPRNQGARLTAFELGQHGVPHTVIVDNAGGHLMQHGQVDMVIVGSDRTTRTGDVANKIGTYLKALAAKDNGIAFYVALPSSTIDFELTDGIREIPIEQREPGEVRYIKGRGTDGLETVELFPPDHPVANFAFDVTPARLVTALITERGICRAEEESIKKLLAGS